MQFYDRSATARLVPSLHGQAKPEQKGQQKVLLSLEPVELESIDG